MTSLLACPVHSSPQAKIIARPRAHRVTRSRDPIWYLIPGGHCDCFGIWEPWNSAADPEVLIKQWNERATTAAARVSAARSHTEQQAADFLSALTEAAYAALGFH